MIESSAPFWLANRADELLAEHHDRDEALADVRQRVAAGDDINNILLFRGGIRQPLQGEALRVLAGIAPGGDAPAAVSEAWVPTDEAPAGASDTHPSESDVSPTDEDDDWHGTAERIWDRVTNTLERWREIPQRPALDQAVVGWRGQHHLRRRHIQWAVYPTYLGAPVAFFLLKSYVVFLPFVGLLALAKPVFEMLRDMAGHGTSESVLRLSADRLIFHQHRRDGDVSATHMRTDLGDLDIEATATRSSVRATTVHPSRMLIRAAVDGEALIEFEERWVRHNGSDILLSQVLFDWWPRQAVVLKVDDEPIDIAEINPNFSREAKGMLRPAHKLIPAGVLLLCGVTLGSVFLRPTFQEPMVPAMLVFWSVLAVLLMILGLARSRWEMWEPTPTPEPAV